MNVEPIISNAWNKGLSFVEYSNLINELLAINQTTGNDQSEQMIHYTKLNTSRRNRLLKTITPNAKTVDLLRSLDINILAITEAWCGDTAQNLPYIHLLCHAANVQYKLCLRDKNPDLMDLFLTNGGRAIPKVIFLSKDMEVLATWGPRPSALQKMVLDYKALPEPKKSYEDFSIDIQQWYNQDKCISLDSEISEILTSLSA